MGATPAGVFDAGAERWVAWQETPWARLRYRLVAATLDRVLPAAGDRCRVLDLGGGDGADAVPLAVRGYDVTIVDHSEPLLRRAEAAAAAAGAGSRVRTLHADLADLADPASVPGAPPAGFDVLLCHNVLHYLDDVEAPISRMAALVCLGGLLSLIAPNPPMDVLAAAVRETDPSAALALLTASTVRSVTFDHEMRRLEAPAVAEVLRRCGCTVTARFGIRCVMDLIADDDLKRDAGFFDAVERLELELCDREPYRRIARYWQLVATRGPSAP